jgi:hypothetical protein
MSDTDVQRSLGRLEGLLEGVLASQARVEQQLALHTEQDAENFDALKESISEISGSRKIAAKWAAAVSTLVTLAASVVTAMMEK